MTKPTHRIKETGIELRERHSACGIIYESSKGQQYDKLSIEALGLTLEPIVPEKRKLYAVREKDTGMIFFYERDIIFAPRNSSCVSKYERCPQYDLVFEDEALKEGV